MAASRSTRWVAISSALEVQLETVDTELRRFARNDEHCQALQSIYGASRSLPATCSPRSARPVAFVVPIRSRGWPGSTRSWTSRARPAAAANWGHLRRVASSSPAIYTLASFKTRLARRSSATSRRSRTSSSRSLYETTAGRSPRSASSCRTRATTCAIGRPDSCVIRTPRSNSSGGYYRCLDITRILPPPSLSGLPREPPQILGRSMVPHGHIDGTTAAAAHIPLIRNRRPDTGAAVRSRRPGPRLP